MQCRELLVKIENSFDRVGLDALDVSAVSHMRRVQERKTGDVINVRSIEEPIIATGVDLFITNGEHSGQNRLNTREEPFRNYGCAFN